MLNMFHFNLMLHASCCSSEKNKNYVIIINSNEGNSELLNLINSPEMSIVFKFLKTINKGNLHFENIAMLEDYILTTINSNLDKISSLLAERLIKVLLYFKNEDIAQTINTLLGKSELRTKTSIANDNNMFNFENLICKNFTEKEIEKLKTYKIKYSNLKENLDNFFKKFEICCSEKGSFKINKSQDQIPEENELRDVQNEIPNGSSAAQKVPTSHYKSNQKNNI